MAPRICPLAVALACVACDRGPVPGAGVATPTSDAGASAVESDAAAPGDAGAALDAPVVPPRSDKLFELLDDMEGGQANLVTPIGLASWFLAPADPSRTAPGEWEVSDADAPRGASLKAQHVRVGAAGTIDLRIDIHGPAFQSGGPPYPDVSAYAGVAFWARGLPQTSSLVAAIEDDQVASGRSYAETRASQRPWFEHPVKPSSEWRRHILLFDDFRQPEHPDGRLRTQAVWSVHFVAGLDGAGAELWIDDLALLCRGSCPAPVWDVHPTPVSGTDDRSLSWLAGDGTSPDTTCARIAPLSMAPPSNVPVDGAEKLLLRARVPVDPAPAVTIWAWVVENVATGARLDVAKIDESWATVAVPITEAGRYRVGAHTHYPASAVCGVSIEVEAR